MKTNLLLILSVFTLISCTTLLKPKIIKEKQGSVAFKDDLSAFSKDDQEEISKEINSRFYQAVRSFHEKTPLIYKSQIEITSKVLSTKRPFILRSPCGSSFIVIEASLDINSSFKGPNGTRSLNNLKPIPLSLMKLEEGSRNCLDYSPEAKVDPEEYLWKMVDISKGEPSFEELVKKNILSKWNKLKP